MNIDNADLVLHPIRLQLIRALAHQKMSIAQLLEELDTVPIATGYRHINKLLEAGLIYVCDERVVKGTIERIFALPQQHISSTAVSKETCFNYFSTFVATLLDDYKRYLDTTNDIAQDGVDYQSIPLYLSDAELAAMAKDLHQALSPYLELKPTKDRVKRIFSTVLVPKKSESRRKNECAS